MNEHKSKASIKIKISLWARNQSRENSYSWVEVKTILNRLGWSNNRRQGMPVVQIEKTFENKKAAIEGRRELHRALEFICKKFPYLVDSIERV